MTDLRKYEIAKLYEQLNELHAAYITAVETGQSYDIRKQMRNQMRSIESEIRRLKEEESRNDPEG